MKKRNYKVCIRQHIESQTINTSIVLLASACMHNLMYMKGGRWLIQWTALEIIRHLDFSVCVGTIYNVMHETQ